MLIKLANSPMRELHIVQPDDFKAYSTKRVDKEIKAGWPEAAVKKAHDTFAPVEVLMTPNGLATGALRSALVHSFFGAGLAKVLMGGRFRDLPFVPRIEYGQTDFSSQDELLRGWVSEFFGVPITDVELVQPHSSSNSLYNLGSAKIVSDDDHIWVAIARHSAGSSDAIGGTYKVKKPGVDSPLYSSVAKHVNGVGLYANFPDGSTGSEKERYGLKVSALQCDQWFGNAISLSGATDIRLGDVEDGKRSTNYTELIGSTYGPSIDSSIAWYRGLHHDDFQPEDDEALSDGWVAGPFGARTTAYVVGAPSWTDGFLVVGKGGDATADESLIQVESYSLCFGSTKLEALLEGEDRGPLAGMERSISKVYVSWNGSELPRPDPTKLTSLREFFQQGGTLDELRKQTFTSAGQTDVTWGQVLDTAVDFGSFWIVMSAYADGSNEFVVVDTDGAGNTIYWNGTGINSKGDKIDRSDALLSAAAGASVAYDSSVSQAAKTSFIAAYKALQQEVAEVDSEFDEPSFRNPEAPWNYGESQIHALSILCRAPDRTGFAKLTNSSILYGMASAKVYRKTV